MPRLALLLLVFILAQNLVGQTPIEIHQRLRKDLIERNYPAVIGVLRELETKDPARFAANNYDYLLGRVSEKLGDPGLAMSSFQRVANRRSVLKEYALWHLARLARATGNLVLERIYLEELIAFASESLLRVPAHRRLAESWYDSGNYDLAIRQIELRGEPQRALRVKGSLSTQSLRKDRAFLAEAYLRSGNVPKARELFSLLTTELVNPAQPDDLALAGVRGLDATEPEGTSATLTDYEHLRRSAIYQFNRDFEHARVHYAAIIDAYPSSGIVPDAILQTARGYTQQGDHTEALKWYERVLERFPDHPASQEAMLQAASAYARLGKSRESATRYKKYIERYPQGERLDRAYLNIIDVLRDQREEIEALKWAARVREKFKGQPPEALATFAEVRMYLARNNWESALTALDRLLTFADLGTNAPGGTSVSEVRFLRAYSLEQLRRHADAIDAYLAIPDGRNEYYGGRATERLRLMLQDETARTFVAAKVASLRSMKPTDPDASRRILQSILRLTDDHDERSKLLASLRASYAATPGYNTAPKYMLVTQGRQAPVEAATVSATDPRAIPDELLFLGLYDEAATEVEARGATITRADGNSSAHTKSDLDYTIAVLYTRGDMAQRGLAFIESAWKIPPDYELELIAPDILALLYPTPYVDALMRHAPPRNVDPRFLLSIMRQESGFRPEVKSYAAARGLMQFISTTAKRVAAELEREDFVQDDLYDPSTAILFGSHYAGSLFKLFPGQPPAVAASYNGGEDNMGRWLSRSKSDQPDRYVPEIAFSQSKDYVWRVMANYRVYRTLYDEKLKHR